MEQGGAVLAAGCGSGKTNMAIRFIERFIKKVPLSLNEYILVLTHGQSVLREQFSERVIEVHSQKPNRNVNPFTFKKVAGTIKELGPEKVLIALPHAFRRAFPKGKIKALIVDEAHHYYHSDMVQKIIKHYKPEYQLLLTGTPSPFVKSKEFSLVSMPVGELLDKNVIAHATVEIVESAYKYNDSSYTNKNEIKAGLRFKNKDTNRTLENVLAFLQKKLAKANGRFDWSQATDSMQKTFIACKDQKQARQVRKYFKSQGVDAAISTTDTDKGSCEIKRFVSTPDCKILIVVARGVLGFNMPELGSVIDMTGSHNIDRLFQLMSRVIRKHPKVKKKLFLKLTNKETYASWLLFYECFGFSLFAGQF